MKKYIILILALSFSLYGIASAQNFGSTTIKIEREKILMAKLPDLSLQILNLVKSRGRIRISEVVTLSNANRNTIKKHLEQLVTASHLEKNGISKGVWYSIK